ncbi:tetratricopeptide repeat protein [Variovorax sp. YR752]|uniref:YfgM family protein n=1 Tax=Variovorax sp. YR752 TaxID=1884383 RepID=UPI00313839D0
MATHLDLEEQEQLDQLKAFWKQYGNLITWGLTLVLAGFAAWNGWNWWQRDQAVKAAAMFDELEKAATAGEASKAAGIFRDLQERYPRTAYAQQGGLVAAKVQFEKGQADEAAVSLAWVAGNAKEDEYQTVARLRLAGLLADQKKFDEALKQLDGATAKEFEALVADRRGDILLAQGKTDEARAAFRKAWDTMDPKVEYRRLIDAKLTSMGAAPPAEAPQTAGAAK